MIRRPIDVPDKHCGDLPCGWRPKWHHGHCRLFVLALALAPWSLVIGLILWMV